MERKDIANQMLDNDSVSNFEKQIGKRYKEWTESEQLQFLKQAVVNNQLSQTYLKSIGDTHYEITWKDFLILCEKQGFEIAYRRDFLDDQCGPKNLEEEVVLIHKEKGFVLYANSIDSKKIVNNATLYGEIRIKEDVDKEEANKALYGYSHFDTEYGTEEIHLDVRNGMVARLSQLDGKYEYVTPWNKMLFVYFVNYMEQKTLNKYVVEPFDKGYEIVNQQKIALMSSDAQQIMGYSSTKKL